MPKHEPTPKVGRPRIPDWAALTRIIFALKTGIPWEDLPQEMGCGSGMTCWRRLRDWREAGVWESLHHVILQNLHDMKKIDWSRACIDGSVIQAKRWRTGPNPVDRGCPGSKYHSCRLDRFSVLLGTLRANLINPQHFRFFQVRPNLTEFVCYKLYARNSYKGARLQQISSSETGQQVPTNSYRPRCVQILVRLKRASIIVYHMCYNKFVKRHFL